MVRRGFTVAELLITTAIIMMLAAITVPALQQARSAARRVTCGSRMRSLLLGTACYAQMYSGWAPPGPREMAPDGQWSADPDRGSPLELFAQQRIGTPGLSSQNGWYSQGLLWQQKVISQGKFYYCPELEGRGWGYALAWPQDMEIAPDLAGEKAVVTGSYVYRGGYATAAGAEAPCNTGLNSDAEALFADSPMFGTMWHPGGYTAGYLGGQVEFRTFAKPPVSGTVLAPFWTALSEGD